MIARVHTRWGAVARLAVVMTLGEPGWATAQSAPSIASQMPVEVLEVVSGGTWSEGSASGSYRTISVQSASNAEISEVYVQWIGSRTASSPMQIISSIPLREFNEKKLGSASVSLESENDGEARIGIAAQDTEGHPSMTTFSARMPGRYELLADPAPVAGK
jgi:hypothetical protein